MSFVQDLEIVTESSADIYQDNIADSFIEVFGEILDGVEAWIAPDWFAGSICTHVVIENREIRWILIQPCEEGEGLTTAGTFALGGTGIPASSHASARSVSACCSSSSIALIAC